MMSAREAHGRGIQGVAKTVDEIRVALAVCRNIGVPVQVAAKQAERRSRASAPSRLPHALQGGLLLEVCRIGPGLG
jgi:hypothetical protein